MSWSDGGAGRGAGADPVPSSRTARRETVAGRVQASERGTVLLGLISDTHGRLRPEVFRHFDGVDRILHAGDVGAVEILDELAVLAPVSAVWGNTDDHEVRAETAEVVDLEIAGRLVRVLHGHQLGSPTPVGLVEAHPDADIIVFGHTHRPEVERIRGKLVVNPGAAGPARFRLRPSIAVMRVDATGADVRLIEL